MKSIRFRPRQVLASLASRAASMAASRAASIAATLLLTLAPVAQAQPQEPGTVRAADQAQRWPDSRSSIEVGETVIRELTQEAGRLFDDTYFDVYSVAAQPGVLLSATMASDVFDPVLILVDPQGFVLEINDNENTARGSTSRIDFLPSVSGDYQIWVNSVEGGTGQYSLSLASRSIRDTQDRLTVGQSVEAWLAPGDQVNSAKSYEDTWRLTMPNHPVAILGTASELDLMLWVRTAAGELLYWADDLEARAKDTRPLLYLAPSAALSTGDEIQIGVSTTSELQGGQYKLITAPFPATSGPATSGPASSGLATSRPTSSRLATVRLRVLRVQGANGEGGSRASAEDVSRLMERTRQVWRQCDIDVRLDSPQPRPPVSVPGLEQRVVIDESGWSESEIALQSLQQRVGPHEGVITVFVVPRIEGGGPHGDNYPSTLFTPTRVGIVLSDTALREPRLDLELARQLGEMLGLSAPEEGDGDPDNDTRDNLMSEQLAGGAERGKLTALQCALARRAPHFIQNGDTEFFTRFDVVLGKKPIQAYLLPGDDTLSEGEYFDLYSFHGKKGEEIRLELMSEEFDAYLTLGFSGDDDWSTEDDDGGNGTNSRLEITLPKTGDYKVGVTSALPLEVGAYELKLERASSL